MAAVASPRRIREAVKPSRLNFAGICLHCGEHECEAAACERWHARSRWIVCPDCGGEEWTESLNPCVCMFGVVEWWPAPEDGS
jgi:hypothetical protein